MAIIPLFPLHAVVFPGEPMALHIFEPRYRQLVQDGYDFGIVLIREGWEVGAEPELHSVGTLVKLSEVEALADGRYNIKVRGQRRFRIRSTSSEKPYLTATVEYMPEPPVEAGRQLAPLCEEYLRTLGLHGEFQLDQMTDTSMVWLAGAILQLEQVKLQELLETGDPGLAGRLLITELDRWRRMGRLLPVTPEAQALN